VRILYGKNLSPPFSPGERSECPHQGLEAIKPEEVIRVLSPFFK
jgi:hypothetical protein